MHVSDTFRDTKEGTKRSGKVISLVVLVCASITTFPYHADAVKPLDMTNERNVGPGILLNRRPIDMAVDSEGTIFVSHPLIDALSIIMGIL